MKWLRRLFIPLGVGILFTFSLVNISQSAKVSPSQRANWLPPVGVPNTQGSSYHPRLAVDSKGTVHMVWMDWVDLVAHPPYLVYANKPAGAGWSAFSYGPGAPEASSVAAVMDSLDALHVVWSSNTGIHYARRNASGSWDGPEPVSASGMLPDIAVAPDGSMHVVWLDGKTVYYSTRLPGGWSPRQEIYNHESASTPMIAADNLENVHVLLGNTGAGARNEYTVKPVGAPWTAPTPLPFDTVFWTVEQLASGPTGIIHLVWGEMDWNAMKYLVRYAYLAPGGGWSSVETIATETYPVYTAVAGDCLGTPHVLWNVRDQEDNRLRYAVKDPEHGWAVSTSQEMEAAHLWVSEGLSLAVECPATHPSGGRHAAWDTGPVYTPYDPADGRGEIYSTSLAGEPPSSIFLTSSGGRLHSFSGSAHYHFAPASVLTDTFVTHVPTGSPPTGNLQPVTIFELTAEQASDGVPLSAFQKPYTLTMTYSPASLGTAIESSLQVYAWDGGQWTALPGTLDIANHQVTAQTDQVGYLALLGETKRVYLPITCRGQ